MNATEIAATTARAGAFSLGPNSRDAALVLSLTPAAYSAGLGGQSGANSVALVEVYDATSGVARGEHVRPDFTPRVASLTGATGPALVEIHEVP